MRGVEGSSTLIYKGGKKLEKLIWLSNVNNLAKGYDAQLPLSSRFCIVNLNTLQFNIIIHNWEEYIKSLYKLFATDIQIAGEKN